MSEDKEILKIEKKITHGIAILTLAGRILDGEKLNNKIKKLINAGIDKIIIDLGEVSRVSSSGLGILMARQISLNKKNGKIKLARVRERIESILIITQMNESFETYDHIDLAYAAFEKEQITEIK